MIFNFNKFLTLNSLRQFFRYVLVGVITNLIGYSIYLILTYLWGHPKLTMTVLYFIGASIGFLANRRFTFTHEGHIGAAGLRYSVAHGIGYLLNLLLLYLFVDRLSFPHQIVQAGAIVVVAVYLFVILRIFVFAPSLAVIGEKQE
jgi:putative flippase GtrA